VDRRTHQLRANRAALGDRRAELAGCEGLEARPERDVRVLRHLRLHAHEPLDHLDRGDVGAREQTLALEECAIQPAWPQDVAGGSR
jgi:hypothetical protein